jgi:hypothetical protein
MRMRSASTLPLPEGGGGGARFILNNSKRCVRTPWVAQNVAPEGVDAVVARSESWADRPFVTSLKGRTWHPPRRNQYGG